MFMFHIALALSLLSLCAGTALYAFSGRFNAKGSSFASLIGILVILVSLGSAACSIYYGAKGWQSGFGPMMMQGKPPVGNPDMMMNNNNMMEKNKNEGPRHRQ